jgi:hypothetical protein
MSIRSQSDARGAEARPPCCDSPSMVATSLATQALLPGTTGQVWMKSVPHLSSHDDAGRVQLEGLGPTRNRKVVGSNPTSGSISAGGGPSSNTSKLRWSRRWQPQHPELTSIHLRIDPLGGVGQTGRAVRFAIDSTARLRSWRTCGPSASGGNLSLTWSPHRVTGGSGPCSSWACPRARRRGSQPPRQPRVQR